MAAEGAHEVIVNAPESVLSLAELPAEHVTGAMEVWRERMRAHADSAYVQLIVNERREAGASLEHTHAQLYALDFVPGEVARERERCGAYATRTMGRGLLEDLVAEEVRRERADRGDRRGGCADGALRIAAAVPADARPAHARGCASRTTGRLGAALLYDGLAASGAPLRVEPALEHVGEDGAAGGRALLLADRRGAAT